MKKKISGIYKIENLINHKVYIGQSKDIESRLYHHKHEETNKHLKYAFEKYGIENFSFEVLIETYDRNYWEIFLIQIYHATDDNFGYNIECGGTYGSPIRTEEEMENYREMRREIYRNFSESKKKKLAKEHSEKMRKRIDEQGLTEAEQKYRDSMKGEGNNMFGRHRTEEEKKYLSELHKGKKGTPHTEEHKNKMKGGANPSAMKIQCVETKEIFDTCKEAFEKYKGDSKTREFPTSILDKPIRTWKGYHWIRLTKRKRILCVETNKIYKSLSEASKETNTPKNLLNECVLGRREFANSMHWKYIE